MGTARSSENPRTAARRRRHLRIRRKVAGTTEIPRLCVFRSLRNMYAQIIDDSAGATVVSASSMDKEVRGLLAEGDGKFDVSKAVGKVIAERAKEKGIKKVRFDRSGYPFQGRVKALADAAREGGLLF